MVQEIRRVLGSTGETGRLGQALEWKTGDKELVSYQVTASPREGETNIQVVSRRDGAAFLTYFISGLLGVFGATAIASTSFPDPVALLAAVGALGGVMATARFLVGRWGHSSTRTINRLMDKLESIIADQQQAVASPVRVEQTAAEAGPSLSVDEPGVVEETPRRRARDSA
jgi:hypothetical protein